MADDANEALDREITARTMAPSGASQDLFLRALQPVFAARFRTRLIVDNVPGEDGVRAAQAARNDPPDGRHLLVTSASTMSFYPAAGEAGFTEADFDMLLGVGRYSFVLITAATQPWSDLREAFESIGGENRALRYAGTGLPDALLVRAMARRSGVPVDHIPLNGPALHEAVLKGDTDIGLGTGTHQPLLADGRVREVAQLHPHAKTGPGAAPTPKDFGVDAMLDNFILISAPQGLAAAERARLVDQLSEAVATPEVQVVTTERLLMAPGLLHGADLAAAIEAQKQAFDVLRSESPGP
jgi:tripartite-type tricarboxylate transporter receptor subunit TctC